MAFHNVDQNETTTIDINSPSQNKTTTIDINYPSQNIISARA